MLPIVLAVSAKGQESEFDKRVDDFVGNHVEMRSLLTRLQGAVAAHNPGAVAAMVKYPIRVRPSAKTMMIRTPAEFVAKYDRIMLPGIVQAIEAQKYEDLFVRDQGAMVGNGQIWFSGICSDKTCAHSVIRVSSIQNTAAMK